MKKIFSIIIISLILSGCSVDIGEVEPEKQKILFKVKESDKDEE